MTIHYIILRNILEVLSLAIEWKLGRIQSFYRKYRLYWGDMMSQGSQIAFFLREKI